MALIRVRGADAASFLQAQVSNDVMRLGQANSQQAAWCDAKGRVLCLFRIFRRDDAYMLMLPAELLETVLKRLRMFVLRARVELADVSDELQRFALFGPRAEQFLTLPAVDEVRTQGPLQCLRLPGETPSLVLIGADEDCKEMWQKLAQHTTPCAFESWQADRILAGQPQVFSATQGEFVPQMLNLHWVRGIDFQKGCYPGQEVVARLQYRGTLKRRMFLAQLDACVTPEPATTIQAADGSSLGQVVMAAPRGPRQQILLAVLKVDFDQALLGGQTLRLLELPYATPV